MTSTTEVGNIVDLAKRRRELEDPPMEAASYIRWCRGIVQSCRNEGSGILGIRADLTDDELAILFAGVSMASSKRLEVAEEQRETWDQVMRVLTEAMTDAGNR